MERSGRRRPPGGRWAASRRHPRGRARTGPPWPRNCACAVADATSSSASTTKTWAIVAALAENSGIGRTHSQGADFFAHRLLAERGEKGAHRRPLAAVFHQEKIIVLGRDRGKAKPIKAGNRFDRNSPIGAALRDRGCDSSIGARVYARGGRPAP